MKIPNPYFENVPNLGNLRMERIIVDYDYPLLSVLTDKKQDRYLSMCFDTRGSQQWLIAPIPNKSLIQLLTNEIPLDAPYRESPANVIHAVRNYETKTETFYELRPADIPEENLPAKGEYLDAEDDEWEDYIEQLREQNGLWAVSYEEPPIYVTKIPSWKSRTLLERMGIERDFEHSVVRAVFKKEKPQNICLTHYAALVNSVYMSSV